MYLAKVVWLHWCRLKILDDSEQLINRIRDLSV